MAYVILSLLFFLTLLSYNIRFSITVLFTVLFATISIGGLLEIAQSTLTTNRSGSWDDAIANAFGASLGCVSYGLIWLLYQRQHESSIL
ncbi:hypothetical protein AL038_05700 [Beggiatoa leptomitoformis]|uniref:VanZ-like domain-containing protein n=2 Tax=Beggiatoa leptomitoformis TaxID=288004 RepID=A0A2N9YA03_9GAMM|nr:hypothetical protein AL038_05700 [Beggiatoa leptomitoformis]AUI67281.1 hypothetical protein BLE401_00275 [Beggiatoa leptomitoformis]